MDEYANKMKYLHPINKPTYIDQQEQSFYNLPK